MSETSDVFGRSYFIVKVGFKEFRKFILERHPRSRALGIQSKIVF